MEMADYFATNPSGNHDLQEQQRYMLNEKKLSTKFSLYKNDGDKCVTCSKCLLTVTAEGSPRTRDTEWNVVPWTGWNTSVRTVEEVLINYGLKLMYQYQFTVTVYGTNTRC